MSWAGCQNKSIDVSRTQRIPYTDLPKSVRADINNDFGIFDLGVWRDLPFEDSLGLYLNKASNNVSFLPQLPYGESVYSNIITYLIAYKVVPILCNSQLIMLVIF